MDVADGADIESLRRVKRAGRDQNRRHADQRMEGGDEFGHRGHRHAPRDHRANTATECETENHQRPGAKTGRRMRSERRRNGDGHAGHAEEIALPAGFRVRQAAQGKNEENARDEIKKSCDIGGHGLNLSEDVDGRGLQREDALPPGHDGNILHFSAHAAVTSFSFDTSRACAA